MKSFALLSLLVTFLSFPASAAGTWESLLNWTADSELELPVMNETLRYRGECLPKSKKVSRSCDYFGLVGLVDAKLEFTANRVEVVREVWTLQADGNWLLDQWIITAELDGRLRRATHGEILESSAGMIISTRTFPETEESKLQQWNSIKQMWIESAPHLSPKE